MEVIITKHIDTLKDEPTISLRSIIKFCKEDIVNESAGLKDFKSKKLKEVWKAKIG